MEYEQIKVSREGGVEWVTLARPERLNALTARMAGELLDAVGRANRDPGVRCLVVTGEGRAFCAGQDLKEFSGGVPDVGEHLRATYNRVIPAILDLDMPVICSINGVAAGAGFSLALACDIRIASDAATFTQAFIKLGLVPDSGGTYLLPRVIGYPRALRMSITGDVLDARTASAIGAVNEVVPAALLRGETAELAKRLAALPTRAVGATKNLMRRAMAMTLEDALEAEAGTQREMAGTDDFAEGLAAFLEKRDPAFRGR